MEKLRTYAEAYAYYTGDEHDIKRDYAKAFKLFLEAAEAGYWEACQMVGKMYADGHGVERNYDEAGKWYTRAKETCTTDSRVWTIHSDIKVLEEKIAAENGDAAAIKKLVQKYTIHKDYYDEAARLYRKLAEGGDAEAQCALGDMYACGEGVNKDMQEAIRWYELALDQKYSRAALCLGQIYAKGHGVERDLEAAAEYAKSCNKEDAENLQQFIICITKAEAGDMDAMKELSWRYEHGFKAIQDHDEAFRLHKRLAEMGDAASQYTLGRWYHEGNYVEKDINEAITWYKVAAEHMSPYAAINLAQIYIKGDEVERDLDQAERYVHYAESISSKCDDDALWVWLNLDRDAVLHTIEVIRAAEAGNTDAQKELALEYLNGGQLGYNEAEAARLLKLSVYGLEHSKDVKLITKFILEHNLNFRDNDPFKARFEVYTDGVELYPYFYPPHSERESHEVGSLVLVDDWIILVRDLDNGYYYLLQDCDYPSIDAIAMDIEEYYENSMAGHK